MQAPVDPRGLGPRLEALLVETPREARLARDPVRFVHRYDVPIDQEVAAILSGTLAYGRVAAFGPVLERLFTMADASGGPRAWVDAFEPDDLAPLVYRWNRGIDWILLLSALRRLYQRVDSLEALLTAGRPLPEALDDLVGALRDAVVAEAPAVGVSAEAFGDLPRGVRMFLPRPADGSATKRWWMILRWLIRPSTEGIDRGLWTTRSPSELVVPLDTHVLRIARYVGLTTRKDGSLRTALEVTAGLRAIDPDDPVRFDFALAHLGISGGCKGQPDEVCVDCPLIGVCTVGGPPTVNVNKSRRAATIRKLRGRARS
ncbi:MAG: TIGR02757 family protein [Myxococcota bacterium]